MQIIAIAAISLDGFIAEQDKPGTGFTSQEDQDWFFSALRDFDCSLVGRKTFAASRACILENLREERLRWVWTHTPGDYRNLESPGLLEFVSGSPENLVSQLISRGKERCAILGGGSLYRAFLEAGLIDELRVTVEPVVFGQGVPFFDSACRHRLELQAVDRLGTDTLLLKYRPTPVDSC